MKVDVTRIIGITASVLGVAASLVAGVAQDKLIKKEVAKEVAKHLGNK